LTEKKVDDVDTTPEDSARSFSHNSMTAEIGKVQAHHLYKVLITCKDEIVQEAIIIVISVSVKNIDVMAKTFD
jgi:hypothetical protein